MIRHKLLTAVAAAALAGIAPAAAQSPQQTPENAQRFLTANLPTFYRVWVPSGCCVDARRTSPPTATDENCTTAFNDERGSSGVHWRNVAEVRHAPETSVVSVQFKNMTFGYHFDFQSPALAARAAFAMEFLRQHCDPSADTGF